jgi:hypothetical protein
MSHQILTKCDRVHSSIDMTHRPMLYAHKAVFVLNICIQILLLPLWLQNTIFVTLVGQEKVAQLKHCDMDMCYKG